MGRPPQEDSQFGALIHEITGKAIEKVIKVVYLTPLNKIAGLGLGLIKMCFFIGGAVIIIESYDERKDILHHETKGGSLLYYPIKKVTTSTFPAFNESKIFLKNTLEENLPSKDKKKRLPSDRESTDDQSKITKGKR